MTEPASLAGNRLLRDVGAQPERSIITEIAVGALAALIAVGIRYILPLNPNQLPTLSVVVMLAVVTTFVGMWAGITTAIVGGLLSWYLVFNPHSLSLANDAWIPLLGFAVIATVIVTTAQLYRSSERRHHDQELQKLQSQAENAELFAREMAHRLKNALAIVQSIAFQTIGAETPESDKLAGRLKALADANSLLSEHIQQPTANIAAVIDSALSPFRDEGERFEVKCIDALIPAQQVVSLALAIHELGTNAIKYGALSSPNGFIFLEVDDLGDQLRMSWKEQGGPAVKRPVKDGFGTRLLRRSGMSAELKFASDGLLCTMGIRKA